MSFHLLHAADLHLSQGDECKYGLGVLRELVDHARQRRPQALLLSGDFFDTHADFVALAREVAQILHDLKGIPIYFVPGNHELREAPGGRLDPNALQELERVGVHCAHEAPQWFTLPPPTHSSPTLQGTEEYRTEPTDTAAVAILAVPYRESLSDYRSWPSPPPGMRWRIGMLHGVVNGMSFTGESEEEDVRGAIDAALFQHWGLNYVALGHIHGRREQRFPLPGETQCLAHYPGSARVWRRGELDPRYATWASWREGAAHTEAILLEAAGAYLLCVADVEAGRIENLPPADWLRAQIEARAHPKQDWMELCLEGWVESEADAQKLRRELEGAASGRLRKLDVNTDSLLRAERFQGISLLRDFEQLWARRLREAEHQPEKQQRLRRARALVLQDIQEQLGRSP